MISQSVESLRILVADDDAATCALMGEQLIACGHQVVARATTAAEAVVQAAALRPDVAVLDLHMPGGSGVDAAALVMRGDPAPGVVLFTGDLDAALSDGEIASSGAFAVLAKPASRMLLDASVRLAAARARELAAARHEAAAARQQLADRKTVERAKGILMRRTGASEQEAYRILQRSSQDRAVPMVRIAQAVLDSEPGAARA